MRSLVLGWALNPVTGAITRRGDSQRATAWGQGQRLEHCQCSGPHGHQKPEEARKDPFLEPAQVAGPCQHLDLGLLWPPDLETHFCCLSLPACGTLSWQPWEHRQRPREAGPPTLEPSSNHLSHSQGPYFLLSGQYRGVLPSTHFSHSSSGPRSANGLKDSPAHEVHRYDLNLLSLKFSFP